MNLPCRSLLIAVLSIAVLVGCKDHDTVAPADRDASRSKPRWMDPAKDPLGSVPVTVPADALTVGTTLSPTGAVQRSPGPFGAADTVHVSFPTAGQQPGAPVVVYWTYQDGRSHHEERTQLPASGEFAHYSFSSAQGMRSGRYNVEVQVRGRPLGIADFTVL